MLKILHYHHCYNSKDSVYPLVSDFGKSNTDTSKWRPDISIARAQMGVLSGRKLLYDFPDGKDSGEVVQTFIRSPGLDITEIESAEARITQIIENKQKDDQEKAVNKAKEDQFNENIQKLADSVSSSDSSKSSSSGPSQPSSPGS